MHAVPVSPLINSSLASLLRPAVIYASATASLGFSCTGPDQPLTLIGLETKLFRH